MVQNRKIRITYLIVVVFLCVLGVSGVFQVIFEFRTLEGIRRDKQFTESS